MPLDESTRMGIPPIVATEGGKRDRAYLVVLAGASVGEMYKIEGDKTVIGRGQKAQIRLLDDGISREHAQLVVRKVTYHDTLDEIFQKQMYESALRDGLTKAFNKKYFTDRLESEFTFATRHASPLTLVLFDIDHFKKVNDTHGHQAGDYVLSEISSLLTGLLRAEDVFARYGGEEFAVICRGSDVMQGQIVAERMRKAVEQNKFVFEGTHIPLTISIGVAGLPDPAVKDA